MLFSKLLNMGLRMPVEPQMLVRLSPFASYPSKKIQVIEVRGFSNLLPPDQYDFIASKKMAFGTVIRNNWEVIPLFLTTAFALLICVLAIMWAIQNKVDVVFQTHSCNNISRTMNLRYPTVHKMMIINQRYEPWPEMQDVLDKMRHAEKQLMLMMQTCSFAPGP